MNNKINYIPSSFEQHYVDISKLLDFQFNLNNLIQTNKNCLKNRCKNYILDLDKIRLDYIENIF